MKVATYLSLKDEAEEFITECQKIFNAEIIMKYRFEDGMTGDPHLLGKIFHAEMRIGDLDLYVADTGLEPDFSSTKFVVEVKSKDLAETFLKGLSEEGKLISNLQKMPYGPTLGTAEDKFGIVWDIVVC